MRTHQLANSSTTHHTPRVHFGFLTGYIQGRCGARNPHFSRAWRSKPTLAKPTLANVKVLVVCKDFWFFGVNCLGFLKLIVQVFFVCFELTWVGPRRVGPRRVGPRRMGPRRVGPRRVGSPTQKKWEPEGWGPEGWEGPKFRAFFPVPLQNSFFSSLSGGLLVEFWWRLKRRGAQMCTFGVLGLSCASPGGPVW